MDIISAYQQVGSYRAAAELCGTTHKTVKRVVEKFEAGDSAPPRAERAHNYDAVTELVAERVEKSQGRMSAKRMLPIARAAGYDGSARNFRRLVAEAKTLWRNEHHRGRRPAVWSPGEYLVIDWAQAAPGLFLFCAVLAFSRWRFVAFATDQKASHDVGVDRRSVRRDRWCPGPGAGRPDGLPQGRRGRQRGDPDRRIRAAGQAITGSHRTSVMPSIPQSKGIVENLCGYAQRDLAVPLLTEAAIAGTPVDLRAANAAARAWCAEVNAAVHSEICAVPDERLIDRTGTAATIAVAAAADRGAVGAPQGRPAVLCPVRLGPLLGAHPADRHHRGRRASITARSAWSNPPPG